MYTDEPGPAGKRLVGVEAVIDKDLASALLAADLKADALPIVTDVDARLRRLGDARAAAIRRATPEELGGERVRRGLDGPEGESRVRVRRADGRPAVIGSITETEALLQGEAGHDGGAARAG